MTADDSPEHIPADDDADNGEASDKPSSLEEQFLASYHFDEDDDFDRELLDLVQTRKRGSVLRPILMVLVIVVVSSVIFDWSDEIAYFFSSSDPLELGDTTTFSSRAAEDPEWEPAVEHNRYVSLTGLPTRISRGGKYEFFRLVGAEIYVQRELDPEEIDEEPSTVPERPGPGLPIDEHRQRYEGEGRLIAFANAPDRVAGLKEHYAEHYNLRFCEDYTDRQLEDLRQQQLETMHTRWRQRYEQTDEQRRAELGLEPIPTEEEERDYLANRPVCVDAYLVHDGQRPIDQWWYVLFSALLIAFMIFTAFKLVRWFQDWLKPRA